MKKIKIQICQGTTCFVMGGDIVKSMLDTLEKKYADKIEITSVRCLGLCNKSDSFSKAPYVCVEDEIISSANLEKVTQAIESRLEK
ncbi:MAG: NAD(P)H-dependent oxidoreductase subunit E [Alphaproteobacteria bacterium]|nr:NAD(P)H-dependent oxidoreductase subunit E [Alphaproteobacteria bacterium]